MLEVEDYEQIRRLFYVEGRSLRQIAKQTGHAARTVKKVLKTAQPLGYRMIKDRAMPKLGLYKTKLDELLEANPKLPRKQRYTTRGMYRQLCALGYIGSPAARQRCKRMLGSGRKRIHTRKYFCRWNMTLA